MAPSRVRVTVVDAASNAVIASFPAEGGKRWTKNKIRDRIGWLWPAEHAMREWWRAEKVCWSEMLRLHDKSRTKKTDRWLTDGVMNAARSHTKACNGFLRRI